jgi:hypothetical protein
MLAKLKAGLDRLDEKRAADVIGAAFVFALPVLTLAVGAILHRGL